MNKTAVTKNEVNDFIQDYKNEVVKMATKSSLNYSFSGSENNTILIESDKKYIIHQLYKNFQFQNQKGNLGLLKVTRTELFKTEHLQYIEQNLQREISKKIEFKQIAGVKGYKYETQDTLITLAKQREFGITDRKVVIKGPVALGSIVYGISFDYNVDEYVDFTAQKSGFIVRL